MRIMAGEIIEERIQALVVSASNGGLNIMSGVHDQHVQLMEWGGDNRLSVPCNPVNARVQLIMSADRCFEEPHGSFDADVFDVSGSL